MSTNTASLMNCQNCLEKPSNLGKCKNKHVQYFVHERNFLYKIRYYEEEQTSGAILTKFTLNHGHLKSA